ncbi:MAG: hypothetical protein QOJ04_6167 [Caballeronia sp.]|nr:hypothetical protein [Caballeronia sp.]
MVKALLVQGLSLFYRGAQPRSTNGHSRPLGSDHSVRDVCDLTSSRVTSQICISAYPRVASIQNIGFPRFSRHKPDTCRRSNASTPDSPVLIKPSQENDMKRSMITLAFVASAVSGWAHAAGTVSLAGDAASNVQTQQWSPARNSIAPKTRAEVRQELVQAQRDGQVAYLNRTLYRGGM